jgi:aminoglycoside phosphotransferase (APT) family kinase protein
MLAESAVMAELGKSGLPVPKVFVTSTDMKKFPVRFQVMEFLEAPSLNTFYRQGTLDFESIAREFGLFLSRLHQHKQPGFGFIDVGILSGEKRICGIDPTWEAYFNKCLPKHLGYLRDKEILSAEKIRSIENIFEERRGWLNLAEGSLLHRDFAYWNILGTPDKICAVIDWDDAVIGDPADDLGIVNCFNSPGFMEILIEAYSSVSQIDENFKLRIWFYTLRNMLWKTMIRHYMGYFDRDKNFFLSKNDLNMSLKEYTLDKIDQAIKSMGEL